MPTSSQPSAGGESADVATSTPTERTGLTRLVFRGARSALKARDGITIRLDPTYRRLAAGYHLPDGTRRVYCHHIRKTAGTSLMLSFLALGGEDPEEVWARLNSQRLARTVSGPYVFASINRRLLTEGAYFFGRAHRPVERQPLPPDTCTVTVLRDPVARVLSYYDYLRIGDAPDTPGQVSPAERAMTVGGFDAFLDRVPPQHLLTQLHTFSTRLDIDEAGERIAGCSVVFTTEGFAQGLSDLGQRLSLPLTVHRARVTGTRSQPAAAQVERLREMLEPEYELLRRLAAAGIGGVGPIAP